MPCILTILKYYCFIMKISFVTDFTSVNSFPEDMKYSTQAPAAFYNMTPPPPPSSRPPPNYDVQNGALPQNGGIISENYYAATDIIKVCERDRRKFVLLRFWLNVKNSSK